MPQGSTFRTALDQKVKGGVLRATLGLPEGVQRALAGRRLTLDGQTLATDTQLMLRVEKLAREPRTESLPVEQGRRLLVKHTAMAGRDQPIGAVRDLPVGERRGRLFVPTQAPATGPLLVYFHGGGWVYGDLDSHDPTCRFLAERSGARVLSVDYRLAPEHPFPAAYDDAVAAYRWVVEHVTDFGGDPTRLAVGGDSAGGNLAALVALAAAREGLPLAFQLLVYPGTDASQRYESKRLFGRDLYLTEDFMDQVMDWYVPERADRADPRVSPLLGRRPARPRSGVRRDRRLRPPARRGRGLCAQAGRRRRGGRAAALRRPDPRVPQRGRRRPLGQGGQCRGGRPPRRGAGHLSPGAGG